MRTERLFACRLPAAAFTPIGTPEPHAMVATEPVGDLLALHREASTLGFSGIRLRNARS